MTNKEAIKNLEIALQEVTDLINNDDVMRVPPEAYPMQKALDIAINAIEKQIPKKLVENGETFGGKAYKFCPTCGHCLGLSPRAGYCSECGQAYIAEVAE